MSRENFPLLPFKIQTCPRNAKKRPQPQQAVVPAMCPDKANLVVTSLRLDVRGVCPPACGLRGRAGVSGVFSLKRSLNIEEKKKEGATTYEH